MKPVWMVFGIALAAFLVWRRRRLEPTLLAGGALVAVAAFVYSLGVVHFPDLEQLLIDVGERLGKWTYVLVGALAFLETGAFIGLIAPGETALLLGGLVAGQGQVHVLTMIAVVWACAVAGDLTSFFLGRRLGRAFMVKHGAKVQITEARLEQVERFFDRHGGKAILIGRFVGLVRAVAPFMAGSSGMPLRRFVPYDVIGAGLWGSTFVVLGYVFWQSFSQLVDYAKKGALALARSSCSWWRSCGSSAGCATPTTASACANGWSARRSGPRCARWSACWRPCCARRGGPLASSGTG